MTSIGMSLGPREFLGIWSRVRAWARLRLLLATFVIPPIIALILMRLMRLTYGEAVGLFMLGVVPGAPLTSRVAAKRGFDMKLAATYQVWVALLTPLMIPVIVYCAAKLYNRDVWISPVRLLKQISENQFVPLLIGMAAMYFLTAFAARLKPLITMAGNLLLAVVIVVLLWKMRAALATITPLVIVAAMTLAVASILAIILLLRADPETNKTLALCNANRHIGLALLLAGDYLKARDALPMIACYALVAPLTMLAFSRIVRRQPAVAASA